MSVLLFFVCVFGQFSICHLPIQFLIPILVNFLCVFRCFVSAFWSIFNEFFGVFFGGYVDQFLNRHYGSLLVFEGYVPILLVKF